MHPDETNRDSFRRAGWTGRVELIHEKLGEPLHWKQPRRIFVCSMSDLFHCLLDDEDIDTVFAVMALCRQHTFLVLTKRPHRMADYMNLQSDNRIEGFSVRFAEEAIGAQARRISNGKHSGLLELPLPNVHMGVSVEDQATADARIPLLLQTPAALRWVSIEPMLSEIDISTYLFGNPQQTRSREYVSREMAIDAGFPEMEGSLYSDEEWEQTTPRLDWVVCGSESGPGARPMDEDWVRAIRDQCVEARVPLFYKQRMIGRTKVSMPELDGEGWDQLPESGRPPVDCGGEKGRVM